MEILIGHSGLPLEFLSSNKTEGRTAEILSMAYWLMVKTMRGLPVVVLQMVSTSESGATWVAMVRCAGRLGDSAAYVSD